MDGAASGVASRCTTIRRIGRHERKVITETKLIGSAVPAR
jgi:hypothetical protein